MPRTIKLYQLTSLEVKKAKPKEKLYRLNDGGGLRLWVETDGAKRWRFRYTLNGKEREYAIGVYPIVSLQEARNEAQKARELVSKAIDPVRERRKIKQEAIIETFADLAKDWFIKEKGRWSDNHTRKIWKSFEDDILPYIGTLAIKEITSADCLAIIKRVESRGALDVASRIKQRMGATFRYGMATGRCLSNPIDPLQNIIQTRNVSHRKMLEPKQLPAFMQALESNDSVHLVTRCALKLLVLTFVRSSELRGARWDEFDLDKMEWRIPAERMKMRAEHIIPLSIQSVSVLDEIRTFSGNFDLVFPSVKNRRSPLSENTLTFAIRKRLKFDATAHGFRALASTILNEQGWSPDAIERQLAHKERNAVRAAYHRSQHLEERRKMMQHWADYVSRQNDTSQIVVNIHRTQ